MMAEKLGCSENELRRIAPVTVMTRGEAGALITAQGEEFEIPSAKPIKVVEPDRRGRRVPVRVRPGDEEGPLLAGRRPDRRAYRRLCDRTAGDPAASILLRSILGTISREFRHAIRGRQIALSRRKWIIIAAVLVLVAGAAEITVHPWKVSKGCVQVVNQGDAAIEDLVLTYAGTKVRVSYLAAGGSTQAWFTAGKLGQLTLEFKQKGNPLTGFQVADYDPASNLREGLKLVLYIKNDRVERTVDDDDTAKARESLIERVKNWLLPELKEMP